MGDITLDIVTPLGRLLSETGLDEVVVRRREDDRELGSELAILRRHGPMLARTCACDVRYTKGGRTRFFQVGAGVMEVLDDHVTLLVRTTGHG